MKNMSDREIRDAAKAFEEKVLEPKTYRGFTKAMPKQHIIKIMVGRKQLQKLAKWHEKGADINALPHVPRSAVPHASRGVVYLFNETALNKWRMKQIKEGHIVEIRAK